MRNRLFAFLMLNTQQVAVLLECAVGLVREDALGKNLAELNAFLIEAVQIPDKALEHDLVLKVCEQSAERSRCQLVTDDDAGRAAALKLLVVVRIVLAAGKGNNLCDNVCTQLLLAGAALNVDICADLAVLEADKLQRGNICALMQQLIERVLTVGARLTENYRTGCVMNRLAAAVDGLAVGLHVQLL